MIPAVLRDNVAGRASRPGAMSHEIVLDRWLAKRLLRSWPRILAEPVLLVAALLASNRLEPMPAGGQSERWAGKPAWMRYLLWRFRNPFEDLRKYYLGFGYARQVTRQQLTRHLQLWWWGWAPFPYYKRTLGPLQLMLGWKSRGIVSLTVRVAG